MIKVFPLFIYIFFSFSTTAQDTIKMASPLLPVSADTAITPKHSSLSFTGYVDVYASYYSDSTGTGNYQKFPSVSPRRNQVGLNVIMFTAKYTTEKLRATATLHYGDIPASAWSSKYNFIQEANAGVRVCKDLWLDAGFFRTHFGTEALFPKENYTSSVSVPTFFEPYYQAGVRLNYNPTTKLSLFIYALNGYGIFEDNNEKKSAGLLVTYVFSDKLNIGYSGYYGDDSVKGNHLRLAHNAFLNFKARKLKITVGGDYVSQQHSGIQNSEKTAFMGSGVLIVSYNLNNKFRVYGRGEAYSDANGVLSGVFMDTNIKNTGLKLWGITGGIEYKPTEDSYIRIEERSLNADVNQGIFHHDGANTYRRFEAMINLGITF